jgi:hypothetical protein
MFAESHGCQKSVKRNIKGQAILKCKSHWKFESPGHEREAVTLTLKQRKYVFSNRTLAVCRLPIAWFPVNRVVREWFPMKTVSVSASKRVGEVAPMILLDVHVDTRKAKKFLAQFSTLKVVPTWERPRELEPMCQQPIVQVVYMVTPEMAAQMGMQMPAVQPVPASTASQFYSSQPNDCRRENMDGNGDVALVKYPNFGFSSSSIPSVNTLQCVPGQEY